MSVNLSDLPSTYLLHALTANPDAVVFPWGTWGVTRTAIQNELNVRPATDVRDHQIINPPKKGK